MWSNATRFRPASISVVIYAEGLAAGIAPFARLLGTATATATPSAPYASDAKMAVLHGFRPQLYGLSLAQRRNLQAEAQSWIVENVSLGGLRTCFDDSSTGDRITLGSLLCMQVEGGDNWLLGMARRLNRLAGGRANLVSRCSRGRRRALSCDHAAVVSRQQSPFPASGCTTAKCLASYASCYHLAASMCGKPSTAAWMAARIA
jgi:hypothetical protein